MDQIKRQLPNTSQHRVVEITGLAKTTIAPLIKQANELQEECAQCEGQGTSQKRKCEGKGPNVDEALE